MDPTFDKKKPESHAHKPRPSTSDLLSSAKVMADAAKASLRHEAGGFEKGRVAGATADLLGAASHYGKLEGKSLGKYADKAETYLRKYHSSHSAHTAQPPSAAASHWPPPHSGGEAHSTAAAAGGYGKYVKMAQGLLNAHSAHTAQPPASAASHWPPPHSAGEAHSTAAAAGGYGKYVKMAQGLLKAHSGGGGGHSGGAGYGDYIEMAEAIPEEALN